MVVELLVVEDCPNERPCAARLRQALDELGLTAVAIRTRVVGDLDEAIALGFVGSPTVLIDGGDPFAEPHGEPALACRMYRTDTGLSGIPALAELRRALAQAAGGDAE